MRIFLFFSLLIFWSNYTTYGQSGPGGVGDLTTNGLWLKADDLSLVSGSPVSVWSDHSGNGNDALQTVVAKQPIYQSTSSLNGMPIVRLDGSNDEMAVLDDPILDNSTSITFFAVVRPNNLNGSPRGILGKRITFTVSTEYAYTWFFHTANRLYHDIHTQNDRYNTPGAFSNATNYILSFDFDGSRPVATRSRMYNGSLLLVSSTETSASIPNSNQNLAIGALNVGYGTYLGADYGDIIHFNYALNSVENIIVLNYLSAKFDISLSANDLYDEDDPGNGDYDFEVAGIGRMNSTVFHDDSQGSAIVRINTPSDLNDNEYLFWGHDNGIQEAVDFTDVPSGLDARFERVWRASEVDGSGVSADVGSINISWDLSGLGAVTASDLRLLVDQNNNGIFSDDTPISGATDIGGNIYEFSNVTAISNNLRFTLGTINAIQTPLPIELNDFTVTLNQYNHALIEWETLSEKNNNYFTLEKSPDGQDWRFLTEINGAGNSAQKLNYLFIDKTVPYGKTYYRLSQTDYDGKRTDLGVRSIINEPIFTIFPNPANSHVTILTGENNFNLKIYNLQGQIILDQNVLETGIEINTTSFERGVYTICVENSTGIQLEKLIVQ